MTQINSKVVDLIEVKSNDTTISSPLKYYTQKLNPKRTTQIVGNLTHPYHKDNILVTNLLSFFNKPPWLKNQFSENDF